LRNAPIPQRVLGCQFPVCNLKWLKIENFAWLYYPHFITYRNETLELDITNFFMLFQAVMKFLSRSKFSLLRKWSIGVMTLISTYWLGTLTDSSHEWATRESKPRERRLRWRLRNRRRIWVAELSPWRVKSSRVGQSKIIN
jgi:hypothetical protein